MKVAALSYLVSYLYVMTLMTDLLPGLIGQLVLTLEVAQRGSSWTFVVGLLSRYLVSSEKRNKINVMLETFYMFIIDLLLTQNLFI